MDNNRNHQAPCGPSGRQQIADGRPFIGPPPLRDPNDNDRHHAGLSWDHHAAAANNMNYNYDQQQFQNYPGGQGYYHGFPAAYDGPDGNCGNNMNYNHNHHPIMYHLNPPPNYNVHSSSNSNIQPATTSRASLDNDNSNNPTAVNTGVARGSINPTTNDSAKIMTAPTGRHDIRLDPMRRPAKPNDRFDPMRRPKEANNRFDPMRRPLKPNDRFDPMRRPKKAKDLLTKAPRQILYDPNLISLAPHRTNNNNNNRAVNNNNAAQKPSAGRRQPTKRKAPRGLSAAAAAGARDDSDHDESADESAEIITTDTGEEERRRLLYWEQKWNSIPDSDLKNLVLQALNNTELFADEDRVLVYQCLDEELLTSPMLIRRLSADHLSVVFKEFGIPSGVACCIHFMAGKISEAHEQEREDAAFHKRLQRRAEILKIRHQRAVLRKKRGGANQKSNKAGEDEVDSDNDSSDNDDSSDENNSEKENVRVRKRAKACNKVEDKEDDDGDSSNDDCEEDGKRASVDVAASPSFL